MLSHPAFLAGFFDAKTCRSIPVVPRRRRKFRSEVTMGLGNNVVGSRGKPHTTAALVVLIGPLALPAGAVAGPPQAFSRCDGEPAARTLGVLRRDGEVACLRLDDTRRVIAAVPLASIDPLKALVARDPKP